jgi:hypothetical protein
MKVSEEDKNAFLMTEWPILHTAANFPPGDGSTAKTMPTAG